MDGKNSGNCENFKFPRNLDFTSCPGLPYPNPSAPPPQQYPGAPPQFMGGSQMMYHHDPQQYYAPSRVPPPSYDAAISQPQYPPTMGYPMPQHQQPNFGFVQPQPYQMQPQYYPPQQPVPAQPAYPMTSPFQSQPYPGGQLAPVTAVFDAGARFHNGQITVPPPPPGYMPTQAQAAAMQGQTVHVQKDKNGFFTGGKGAGFTFW